MKKKVYPLKSIAAAGPYSTAAEADGFIFISGQLGLDPDTGEAIPDIESATRQVLTNIRTILSEIGLSINHIVKTTIYLKNITDFAAVNKIYSEYFSHEPPARSTVEVSNLPKGVLLEIDAIAMRE